ncbi:exosortase-associated protein EpsI, B-type [Derxia gummosa]|uniref:Exosortase-associated protein EpsI, B-type n=1 Tax=Derxia gummosa DSM 723 TaxID=1121388 RepID=A0A8B6XB50_9BURK|nr:exosortase-associated protein EpsI, B-type [Derxia gummosa]
MSARFERHASTAAPAGAPAPWRPPLRRALAACALMVAAAVGTALLTPTVRRADLIGPPRLESAVPTAFGDWRLAPAPAQVVNPPGKFALDQIYAEVLSRTYVNARGDRVMLTIAYGNDQRDGLQMHYPEVCYPAQGFDLLSGRDGMLDTPVGRIAVRRLETLLRGRRAEPVTYWTTVGDKVVRGGIDKKLAEMGYGLRGVIPDGLLFRVSTIDNDSAHAFEVQQRFVIDLIGALPPEQRARLAGL